MLAGAVKSFVRRAFAGRWDPVADGDTVFVIGRIEMALISDENITIKQREVESFVLSSFEDTILRAKSLQYGLSHCGMGQL